MSQSPAANISSGQKKQFYREELLIKYRPLVHSIARRFIRRMPAHITLEDLLSEGIIGLLDAVDKFDGTREYSFGSYAARRIRGAIIDFLREQDFLPRSVRRMANKIHSTVNQLWQLRGRAPTSIEIAQKLGISISNLDEVAQFLAVQHCDLTLSESTRQLIPIWKSVPKNEDFDSFRQFDHCDWNIIEQAIASLEINESKVINLYYFSCMPMHKIGSILHISESRISQIHKKAIQKLAVYLEYFIEQP